MALTIPKLENKKDVEQWMIKVSGNSITNGDSHAHSSGDGGQVNHISLSNKGTNTHAQIDTAVSNSVSHIADSTDPHGSTLKQTIISIADGVYVGNDSPAFGWRDIIGPVVSANTGASKPAFAIYRDTLKQYQFSVGDEEYFTFHIPHDYAPGTNLYIHAHWSHIDAAVLSGSVTWDFEVSYARGYDRGAFPASVICQATQDASFVQYQHMIAETQLSISGGSATQLDTDFIEIDGIIMGRVELTANSMTGVPEPFLHFIDIHYQSTGIATKLRNTPFYE